MGRGVVTAAGGDPYAVLGVSRSATDAEVRAAYRARSMLLHPDLHQERPDHVRREAERAMTQLTEAYETVLGRRAGAGRARAGRGAGGSGGAGAGQGGSSGGAGGRQAGSSGGGGQGAGRSADGTVFFKLGRLASRARTTRVAAEAGEQDGGFAYRLGWLVGRRRSR